MNEKFLFRKEYRCIIIAFAFVIWLHGTSQGLKYYSSNRKDEKTDEKFSYFLSLAAVTSLIILANIPSPKTIKNKFNFWNQKPLDLDSLELLFEQLKDEEKELLYKKNFAEKDSTGDFSLRFICPITKSLMKSLAVLQVYSEENPDRYEIELYDADAICAWLNKPSDFNSPPKISPLTRRPVVTVFISAFKDEYKKHIICLSKEIQYVKKYGQASSNTGAMECAITWESFYHDKSGTFAELRDHTFR